MLYLLLYYKLIFCTKLHCLIVYLSIYLTWEEYIYGFYFFSFFISSNIRQYGSTLTRANPFCENHPTSICSLLYTKCLA